MVIPSHSYYIIIVPLLQKKEGGGKNDLRNLYVEK